VFTFFSIHSLNIPKFKFYGFFACGPQIEMTKNPESFEKIKNGNYEIFCNFYVI